MNSETPNPVSLPGQWQRRLLTALSCAMLGMIGWCNLPPDSLAEPLAKFEQATSPAYAYRLRWCDWGIRYGAHLVGLDGKWQMYGGQSRFNWRYIITAVYSDQCDTEAGIDCGVDVHAEEIVLPLPRQSERSSLGQSFADFKEAKFLLNIYGDALARETYARYLARQYPDHNGRPVTRIRYTLATQQILPPIIAVREQRLLEPEEQFDVIDDFDVSSERLRQTGVILGLY